MAAHQLNLKAGQGTREHCEINLDELLRSIHSVLNYNIDF